MRPIYALLATGIMAAALVPGSTDASLVMRNASDSVTMHVGASTRVVGPTGARWTSTNKRVVMVTPPGQVTALAVGRAYLKATVDGTVADSVLIIVTAPPPPAIAALTITTQGVSGPTFSVIVNWTGTVSVYRWTLTLGTSGGAVGTTNGPPLRLPAARVPTTPAPQVCITPVSANGTNGPASCATFPVPLADSVPVLLFRASDTTWTQGVRTVTDTIGSSYIVCAYPFAQGKIITNATVTWSVSDTTVATFTAADSTTYASVCLSKVPTTLLWPLP